MGLTWRLKTVGALFGRGTWPKPEVDEAERIFRHIFHYLIVGTDKRFPPKREQPNALILQMAKVASTAIQSALQKRGINALHSHGLSSMPQHAMLSGLLERDLSIRLAGGELRRHIHNVALQMLVRWYQQHKQRKGHRLKVVTLTRDPVTHYPSALVQRWGSTRADILAWHRAQAGTPADGPVDEAQAAAALLTELASMIAEGGLSAGAAAYQDCVARAGERWQAYPVIAREMRAWLSGPSWFDREITPIFGLDMLASPEFREHGWAERSNDWVDILLLRFEDLSTLTPQMQRFFALPELTVRRANISSAKPGGIAVKGAMRALLDTPVGRACARELRMSPYGRACGYDRLP